MRLAIVTSNHLRHKFFVESLSKAFPIAGVLIEEKKRDPSKKGEGTDEEPRVKKYFADRDASEKEFFGNVDWQAVKESIGPLNVVKVMAGEINQDSVISILKKWNPEYLIVFGSSILGPTIIDLFPHRIINMHLGLSPFYRGSGTNFWPLYDEKPEYVGATIHYLDKGIDTGKIIAQAKPDIEAGDTPHSIGNKAIKKGTEALVDVLRRLDKGETIEGESQDLTRGKLFLFKDCEPRHIIELEDKFSNGLIERYLKRIKGN